jgi:predicted Fe-Mo cluster-binding NifX family protein
MKIAIPTKGTQVDDHFGHCDAFTVFSIDEKKTIQSAEIVPSPQGCGCKSNIAATLKEKGVKFMLAGNMGNGALNVLHNHGIEVVRGCTGDVRQVAESFLSGTLADSGEGCKSHDHHHGDGEQGHQCNHH